MDIESAVLQSLDQVLGLNGRTRSWTQQTQLLGAVPELDSMAVMTLLMDLSERCGITVDDDIDAEVFATVGSLVDYVRAGLSA